MGSFRPLSKCGSIPLWMIFSSYPYRRTSGPRAILSAWWRSRTAFTWGCQIAVNAFVIEGSAQDIVEVFVLGVPVYFHVIFSGTIILFSDFLQASRKEKNTLQRKRELRAFCIICFDSSLPSVSIAVKIVWARAPWAILCFVCSPALSKNIIFQIIKY